MWQKLTYKSGFENIGRKVFGGWEHTNPVNPDMNDPVIKTEYIPENLGINVTEEIQTEDGMS